jgi:hypothetical protein
MEFIYYRMIFQIIRLSYRICGGASAIFQQEAINLQNYTECNEK